MQEDNLMAVPFDVDDLEVRGEAAVIASGVLFSTNSGHAAFSVSSEGTLIYARGIASIPPATFVWYDRGGIETATPIEPTPLLGDLRLSSNGTRAIALMPSDTGDAAIWVVDLLRGVRTRLTPPAPYAYVTPVLSADGNRVLYVSPESGTWDIYLRNVDGSGDQQPFLLTGQDKVMYDWSRDGNRILFSPTGGGTSDVWIYDSQTQASEVLIEGDPTYTGARFSPDGRHVAYMSDDSGRMEVFIQAIDGGARAQVSTAGGAAPHWRDDGREIVYLDPDRRMMAVSVDLGANGVTLGTPTFLFTLDRTIVSADAAGDHTRFLFATTDEKDSDPLHVILGWHDGL